MRTGTPYFLSRDAAVAYFARQNVDAADVDQRLADGEIFVGLPPCAADEIARLDEGEGRYHVHRTLMVRTQIPEGYPTFPEVAEILKEAERIGGARLPAFKALRLVLWIHPEIAGVRMERVMSPEEWKRWRAIVSRAAWVDPGLLT
jgi:hypothetical protein